MSDLLVTSSSNWFSLAAQSVCHCQHRLMSHFPEELCARVCVRVRAPLAETETDGPTPTGYMCLLSVRTLCQEVWTCMPLRGDALSQRLPGWWFKTPACCFPESGTQGLQRLYMEEVRNVMKKCKVCLSWADEGRNCAGHTWVTRGKAL